MCSNNCILTVNDGEIRLRWQRSAQPNPGRRMARHTVVEAVNVLLPLRWLHYPCTEQSHGSFRYLSCRLCFMSVIFGSSRVILSLSERRLVESEILNP